MFKCFVFVLFLDMVSAHKILVVFPVPSTSHAILGAGYVRSLLEAGHEVTYLTSVLYDKPHPKLQQVDVSHNFDVIAFNDMLSVEKMMTKELDMQDLFAFSDLMFDLANTTLRNPNVVKLLEDPNEKYDVVVTEWLYTEVYSGFALVFDCPLIWSSSMDAHSMVLWLMDEAPNPAYTADHLSHENEPFQFWTRVSQLWIYLSRIYLKWWTESKQSTIYENAFRPFAERKGIAFVPLSKMKYTGALMLGNSHASFTQSLKLPENYKSILGYHIPKEIKALPEDVQKIMDDAKHGVIYFSMGSMMKSASFPATLKRDLIKMFAGLRETVLWKFEEEFTDLPKNVHVFKWLPQLSVLGKYENDNAINIFDSSGIWSLTIVSTLDILYWISRVFPYKLIFFIL